MKIRTFRTVSNDGEYVNINFFPACAIESVTGNTTLFIGWLVWGMQITWNT